MSNDTIVINLCGLPKFYLGNIFHLLDHHGISVIDFVGFTSVDGTEVPGIDSDTQCLACVVGHQPNFAEFQKDAIDLLRGAQGGIVLTNWNALDRRLSESLRKGWVKTYDPHNQAGLEQFEDRN